MLSVKPLCIYHGNCADGFGAAWVVNKFFNGEVDFHAGVYQNPPPDVTRRTLIMVDFSYKREVMLEMLKQSDGILLIDHHKTAIEDLKEEGSGGYIVNFGAYQGQLSWRRFQENIGIDRLENVWARIYTVFDLERSGAGMAWDFFFPDEPRPALISRIEDRDLWRFHHPDTRAVQAAVFSYPYDFATWDMLFKADLSVLRTEGEAIERKHHKDIAELTKIVTRPMRIAGHVVPMANLPYTLTSDAGHLLCGDEYPFAGCYWDTPEGRVFSLRSRENGADVGDIAKQYGGGGHKHASGFRLSFDKARELEAV